MPGVELSTRACEGHVVVAPRGDLDIIGAADAGAAITALVVPDRCLIIDMPALDFIDCGSLDALLRVQWLAWSSGPWSCGGSGPVCQLRISRAASNREY
jgi:anti-anti-sigma regulatory factor